MGDWRTKELAANGEWRIADAEFKGYVKARLDEVKRDIGELKIHIKDNDISNSKNTVDISYIKGQAAVLAIIASAVVSIIVAVLTKIIG